MRAIDAVGITVGANLHLNPIQVWVTNFWIVRCLFFLFFRLSENQKATKFADIKTRIGLAGSGKRYTPIPNDSFQHPSHRGLELVTGPDPVNFPLLGFTCGFTTAAHRRNVRLLEHVALHTSMAYRRIHGHGHSKWMRIMCGTPIISQVIRLQHIADTMDNIRLIGSLMQGSRFKGKQSFRQLLLGSLYASDSFSINAQAIKRAIGY
jgi:hypothetical protein